MNTIKKFIAKWLKNMEMSNFMIPTGCVPQLQMVQVRA